MRKRRSVRKTRIKPAVKVKIEICVSRAKRITDPHQLSWVFFPHRDACMLRAAFIAIFFEIRNDRCQQIENLDFISKTHDIPLSSICKARERMKSVGLIEKKGGFWQYSNRFFNAIEDLVDTIDAYKIPVDSKTKEDVFQMINIAKGMKENL